MGDLTIVLLTPNRVPAGWADYHASVLREAADGAEILTCSRLPMDWGTNLLQDAPESASNVFRQLLRAARLATTPYLAVAEDDTLYPREHFALRPPVGAVGYNLSRWKCFTFGRPAYGWDGGISNATLIGDRATICAALEAREARYPAGVPDALVGEIGRERVDARLGVAPVPVARYWTETAVVQVYHPHGLDPLQVSRRKRLPSLRALEIPHWGQAIDIRRRYGIA